MTRDEVFKVVKGNIMEILNNITEGEIHIDGTLKDLGANSIDRMDIIVKCMESVGVKIPLIEFAQVSNIEGIVDLLYRKKMEA